MSDDATFFELIDYNAAALLLSGPRHRDHEFRRVVSMGFPRRRVHGGRVHMFLTEMDRARCGLNYRSQTQPAEVTTRTFHKAVCAHCIRLMTLDLRRAAV